MTLDQLNALPADEVRGALLDCCGARAWADEMIAARPFTGTELLHAMADLAWDALDRAGIVEAFSAHPRIGERAAAASRARHAAWSADEQAGTRDATADVIEEFVRGNHAYEKRFGHIFLICATGRSGKEIMDALRARMGNDPETELGVAAEEQRRIMHLRLEKLLAS